MPEKDFACITSFPHNHSLHILEHFNNLRSPWLQGERIQRNIIIRIKVRLPSQTLSAQTVDHLMDVTHQIIYSNTVPALHYG